MQTIIKFQFHDKNYLLLFYSIYRFLLSLMNHLNFDFHQTIISDSFLRSYSMSRILKINEENRNKTKVLIMKKMRSLKQEKRKNALYSPFKSLDSGQNRPKKTTFKKLKEELSKIDNFKSVDLKFKKKKFIVSEIREQDLSMMKSQCMQTAESKASMNRTFHRRFKSDAIQSHHLNDDQQIKFRTKVNSQQHKTAELRLNEIKFKKSFKKKQCAEKSHLQEDKQKECTISLSATLSSFNRLRLMTNAKQSEKIMQHFYKRSLQNCSLEELKYLIMMQANRKEEFQKKQNTVATPMKFGKTQIINKGFTTSLLKQPQLQKRSQEKKKKSVWNNQVLRESCAFHENTQLVKSAHKKSHLNSIDSHKHQKGVQKQSKHRVRYQSKENLIKRQSLTQMNMKESQMQTNLVYCYQNKRFPLNENKLSGVYEKWQKDYLKKKRIQEFINDSKSKQCQQRQLKVDSIRLMKGIDKQEQTGDKEIEMQDLETKEIYLEELKFKALNQQQVNKKEQAD